MDSPSPLLRNRQFLVPHLVHPASPHVSEWLEEVTDPFPENPITDYFSISPPKFYRSCDSDSASVDISLLEQAHWASVNPLTDLPVPIILTREQAYAEIVRPTYFNEPGLTNNSDSSSLHVVEDLLAVQLARTRSKRESSSTALAFVGFAFVAGFVCRPFISKSTRAIVWASCKSAYSPFTSL